MPPGQISSLGQRSTPSLDLRRILLTLLLVCPHYVPENACLVPDLPWLDIKEDRPNQLAPFLPAFKNSDELLEAPRRGRVVGGEDHDGDPRGLNGLAEGWGDDLAALELVVHKGRD